jgi:opacity protein-like surface antigen
MFERTALLVGTAACLSSWLWIPATALADGPYIAFLAGGVSTETVEADDINVEYDTGFLFAGQFGYQFDLFRLAGELGYQQADGVSDNDVEAEVGITRFTVNGYLDLPIAGRVGPYLGGGFGVANLRTGDDLGDDFEDEDTAFTWHGEAGFNIGLNDHFTMAPVYRYQWVDSDIGGQSEPLVSHVFGVTLRYQFHGERRGDDVHASAPAPVERPYYDSGYTGYRTYDRFDRFDHYDDRHRRYRYRDDDRQSPDDLERDRCGWQGPGCEDEQPGS